MKVWLEGLKEREHFEELDIDGDSIKIDVIGVGISIWVGLICSSIETGGRLL
jgi:hypothetical protein